ncbi:MAG: KTSC domain-containing protein [Bacteroidetes bacterium QH_9_67_14]|nr:MAG: KTSC domain-containing protein [Bacteroidetes bacterium QH_9_67_14]
MQLTTVESSMIHAAGYDAEGRELEVVFNSGKVYRYRDVDEDVFEELLDAESKGRYMQAHVIGVYPYRRTKG